MYSLILCAAGSILVSLIGFLLDGWGWFGLVFVAVALFAGSWFVVMRKLGARLQPKMEVVRRHAESGQIEGARRALEELLPMGKWVPMLTGQIEAQLGMLALHSRDEKTAVLHLKRSSKRVAEGQLMLAALHHRRKETDEALAVLAAAAPFHAKHSLLQNTYAWMLQKADRLDDAIALLNKLLKKVPDDEVGKDNLKRLQNRQRVDMRGFGNDWYALGLERPPASYGQIQTARKGFRQRAMPTGRKGFRQPPKRKSR